MLHLSSRASRNAKKHFSNYKYAYRNGKSVKLVRVSSHYRTRGKTRYFVKSYWKRAKYRKGQSHGS